MMYPKNDLDLSDDMGDDHYTPNVHETPLREDAFAIDDDKKIELIEGHFREIMHILGLDLTDDSLKGTPHRVAKMYVKEIFSGLNPKNKPATRLFENNYQYEQMLIEKNIPFHSNCEHHFVPIHGRAHIGYFSNGKVIGLSKLNRIVDFYARRPQVQERLTNQIGEELKRMLKTQDVAVLLDAAHFCVSSRGIKHEGCTTLTMFYEGKFKEESVKNEFLKYIQ